MILLHLIFMSLISGGSIYALQKDLQLVPAQAQAESQVSSQFTMKRELIHYYGDLVIVSTRLVSNKTGSTVAQNEIFSIDDNHIIKKDYLTGFGRSLNCKREDNSKKMVATYLKAHKTFFHHKHNCIDSIFSSLTEIDKVIHFNESDLPLELEGSTEQKTILD